MIACQHVYICHSRRRKTAAKVQHAQLLVTRPARAASMLLKSFGPSAKREIIGDWRLAKPSIGQHTQNTDWRRSLCFRLAPALVTYVTDQPTSCNENGK